MEISTQQFKRCTVVKATGRIDGLTAPKLEDILKDISENGVYRLVVDMGEINFFSSAGWWVLIETQKRCKRYNRGEVVLASVPQRIRESLELVGMGSYFRIFDDVTSAVGNF